MELQNLLNRSSRYGRCIMHALGGALVSFALSAAYAMLLIGGGQSADAHAAAAPAAAAPASSDCCPTTSDSAHTDAMGNP